MKLSSNKKLKILIIRLSSIGDIVLTTEFTRFLRKKFPAARIDFMLSQQFSDIYEHNPYVDNIIKYNKELSAFDYNKIRKRFLNEYDIQDYHLIFDLQNNLRSIMFSRGLAPKIYRIAKNRFKKLSMVYFKKFPDTNLSIPEIYKNTLKDFDIETDNYGLEIFLKGESRSVDIIKKYERESKLIAIAPGAFHFTKRWSVDKFIELVKNINNCGFSIVLIGGKTDEIICSKIEMESGVVLKNKAGNTSIMETVDILSKARVLITNDTGVMHIAAARKIPIIAIFGSTVTQFGFAPYKVDHEIIETHIKCRPCTHIGRADCPKKHFNCMTDITVEQVMNAFNELLKRI